jgi:hypothetical protein
MSEQRIVGVNVPEHRIRVLARGDRDLILRTTGEGCVSAVCKTCVRALEIKRDRELIWFRCPKCALVSLYTVANVKRDTQLALKDGRPFVTDLFYMRQLPAELRSPFEAVATGVPRSTAEAPRAPGQWPLDFDEFHEIIGELGHGTSGTVYLAREKESDRRVAIKVPCLVPEAERSARTQQFLLECRALAELTSGLDCNIPRLTEVAERPAGRMFFVRDLVEGSTLEQRAAQGSIDLRTGLTAIAEVARVLQRVHEHSFVHGNLSPANVLIARDGSPRLIGFGWVDLLSGNRLLLAGAAGTPVTIDIEYLGALVRWFCAELGQPVADGLTHATAAGTVLTAGAFSDAVARHL